jgi:hypothetical protein
MPRKRRAPDLFDMFWGCGPAPEEKEKPAIPEPVAPDARDQDDPYGWKEQERLEEEETVAKFTKRGLTAEQVKRAIAIGNVNLEFLQVIFDNHRRGDLDVSVDVFLDRKENHSEDDERKRKNLRQS